VQPFRVVAIPDEVAESVRTNRVAPIYGHPTHIEVAKGYGPCRLCLRTFRVGADRRVLFTYDSFHGKEKLPLPATLFDRANVDYIHVRDTDAGCFDFAIERQPAGR